MLGGVTLKELNDEVAKHPGPPGPIGTPGAPAEIPDGAVIAFDQPGGCPKGWSLAENVSGSAIIGAFMNPAGNPGSSSGGNLYTYDLGQITNGRPERGGFVPGKPEHFSPDAKSSNSGTEYAYNPFPFGTKTPIIPEFLALYYCKKLPR
jgi:hypothetical protein